MSDAPKTILLEPDSDLARAINAAGDVDVIVDVDKNGVRYRYRLNRIDAELVPEHDEHQPVPLDPMRVLNIFGLGAAPGGSDIARFKDQYLADAADHRD